MENSRRRFFKNAGMGAIGIGMSSALPAAELFNAAEKTDAGKDTFTVGLAGWSFVKLKLDPSLAIMDRVNVRHLCIKNFHLPYESTPEEIAAFFEKLKAKGISGYAVGPIYMKSEQEVDQAFDYAKRVGVKLIIGVPEHELLPYVAKKVKEYDFHYAIHNHGEGDKRYPTVESIYEKIKDLDTRVGICHDIGYSEQKGFSPASVHLKYGHRIYEMHVKDMTNASGKWQDCEIGRGSIDFVALVKALRKTRYKWSCSIENETNSLDPLASIAESVGYFNAVLKLS
jgi:sugar phosphate isomerase/epimerase